MQSSNQSILDYEEKRSFPRMETQCSVLYVVGTSKRWISAQMKNISATGICLICDEQLLKTISISVITKPGKNKLVPEIAANGKVAHCRLIGENKYLIGCKFLKVKPVDSPDKHQ